MRKSRVKEDGSACYHVMSRVVDRRMILNSAEKNRLKDLFRRMERFSGVKVLTQTVLGNHFHLLLHVPAREHVSDREFIERLGYLYDKREVAAHADALQRLRKDGLDDAAEEYKRRFTYRMYDVSEYMKTVKQRFTQSYNSRHGRKGTLWEERFKSLLVQPSRGGRSSSSVLTAIAAVAAYIDLNCVRAGLVSDPKDYRFSGYGEAVAGSQHARDGIGYVMGSMGKNGNWESIGKLYRRILYVRGEAGNGTTGKPGFSHKEVERVLATGGSLSMAEALRCRVRYFSDGLILGSSDYVDEVCSRHKAFFGRKRKSGARKMVGAAWGDICTARRLRLNAIIPSAVE